MIMFNPDSCACFIAFNVTCEPCLFITKYMLVRLKDGIGFFKNERNSLNKNDVIHALVCIAIHVHVLDYLM